VFCSGALHEPLAAFPLRSKVRSAIRSPGPVLDVWPSRATHRQVGKVDTQDAAIPTFNDKHWPGWVNNNSDALSRQPIASLVAAIKPVKRISNVEGCHCQVSGRCASLGHFNVGTSRELLSNQGPEFVAN